MYSSSYHLACLLRLNKWVKHRTLQPTTTKHHSTCSSSKPHRSPDQVTGMPTTSSRIQSTRDLCIGACRCFYDQRRRRRRLSSLAASTAYATTLIFCTCFPMFPANLSSQDRTNERFHLDDYAGGPHGQNLLQRQSRSFQQWLDPQHHSRSSTPGRFTQIHSQMRHSPSQWLTKHPLLRGDTMQYNIWRRNHGVSDAQAEDHPL